MNLIDIYAPYRVKEPYCFIKINDDVNPHFYCAAYRGKIIIAKLDTSDKYGMRQSKSTMRFVKYEFGIHQFGKYYVGNITINKDNDPAKGDGILLPYKHMILKPANLDAHMVLKEHDEI
jgi:hypothetical protein